VSRLRNRDLEALHDRGDWLNREAVAELRAGDLTHHEHFVLQNVRDRLHSEERDLVARLLDLHAPRKP
jgi:hypothetical protein